MRNILLCIAIVISAGIGLAALITSPIPTPNTQQFETVIILRLECNDNSPSNAIVHPIKDGKRLERTLVRYLSYQCPMVDDIWTVTTTRYSNTIYLDQRIKPEVQD